MPSDASSWISALNNRDLKALSDLLDEDLDVDFDLGDGVTALMRSSVEGDVPCIRFLLDHGADVNRLDNLGKPAIHHAVKAGHVAVVRELLDHNATVDIAGDGGRSLLNAAIERSSVRIAKLLFAAPTFNVVFEKSKRGAIARYSDRELGAIAQDFNADKTSLCHICGKPLAVKLDNMGYVAQLDCGDGCTSMTRTFVLR